MDSQMATGECKIDFVQCVKRIMPFRSICHNSSKLMMRPNRNGTAINMLTLSISMYIIVITLALRAGGRMPKKRSRKNDILRQQGVLNSNAENVTDPLFQQS